MFPAGHGERRRVWTVLQGVISRASFRRQPRGGKSFFTVLSLHINNNYARKRGIGKKLLLTIRAVMIEEHVDLVAGASTGPRGAAKSVTEISVLSKKLSPTQIYRCLLTPHRCGAQEQCQVIGQTFVGFLKPPDSYGRCKVRQHGAFSIPHDAQGLRPKDQSCHHEVWLHLAFVNHHGDEEPRAKRPYTCSTAPTSTIQGAHDRGSSRPSFCV